KRRKSWVEPPNLHLALQFQIRGWQSVARSRRRAVGSTALSWAGSQPDALARSLEDFERFCGWCRRNACARNTVIRSQHTFQVAEGLLNAGRVSLAQHNYRRVRMHVRASRSDRTLY